MLKLKNKFIILISFIPVIILIIFYMLRFIFHLEISFLDILIPILTILTAIFIPFITYAIQKNSETNKLQKVYQENFDSLGKLSMLCIERKDQVLDIDMKIFQLSIKLKSHKVELLNFNISYNESGKSESIVIEDKVRIWLNVDNSEGRVWGAKLMLNNFEHQIYDKVIIKNEMLNILEDIKKKRKLIWNEAVLKYFESDC